jgi:tripartite-type tricarboxylate transporter receptor subunit TctC
MSLNNAQNKFWEECRMTRLLRLLQFALVLTILAISGAASAANYPERTVRFIVPYAPGGSNDLIARIIARELSDMWPQRVIVEERAGAGGNIGAAMVAQSAPDGYTLLLTGAGPLTINEALYRTPLSYKPETDFAPIQLIATMPLALMVRPSLPVKSVQELVAYARANPGKLSFGSSGNGTTNHLAGELFKTMAHVDMQHIPYEGSARALQDLLAGHIDILFDTMPTVLPQAKSGAVRALAVTSLHRVDAAPNLPTLSESGFPGFEVNAWFGLVGPAKTPPAVLQKIAADIAVVYKKPDVIKRFADLGAEPSDISLDAFKAFLASERAKFTDIIKRSGAHVD